MSWWVTSWPNGVLEIDQNTLILRDEIFKKEIKLSKDEIEKIEIKKYFPIIGYAIKIYPKDKKHINNLSFAYLSFKFDKLINALKEFNYI